MSTTPPRSIAQRCRLSTAAAVLAVVPLLALAARIAVDSVIDRSGVLADVVSTLFELTLLCVPLALPLGLAATWRHTSGPRRPGLALALLGTLLAGAELMFLIVAANAEF